MNDSSNIGDWLKSKAASLEGHVKEIRENTKLIAQDVAGGVQKEVLKMRAREERFEVTFSERALGLELDLQNRATVRLTKPGGQGERLSVLKGDRLVAIDGIPVPKPGDDFAEIMKTRMKEMPRPVVLTFARQVAEDAGVVDLPSLLLPMMPVGSTSSTASTNQVAAFSGNLAELQAALANTRHALTRCECDVALSREDCAREADIAAKYREECEKLRADLADIQLSRSWGSQAQCRALEEEVTIARAQAESARAASDRREVELEAEVELRCEADALAALACRTQQNLREEGALLESEMKALQTDSVRSVRLAKETAEATASSIAVLEVDIEHWHMRCAQESRLYAESRETFEQMASEEAATLSRAREAEIRLEHFEDAERKRCISTAAGERLTTELRREVDRLRKELKREECIAETATAMAASTCNEALDHGTEGASAAIAETIAELTRERDHFAAEIEELRTSVARSATVVPSGRVSENMTPVPRVLGKDRNAHPFTPPAADESEAAELQAVLARVKELEFENANFLKELNSRPIVYQFAPRAEEDEEEEEEEAEGQSTGLVSGAVADARETTGLDARTILTVSFRLAARSFAQCRKTGAMKLAERHMRGFTQKMLRRPVLLWFFYAHILVLWVLEFLRQARSQPTPYDPSTQLTSKSGLGKLLLI